MNTDIVKNIISKIEEEITQIDYGINDSLYSGRAGTCLFLSYYSKYIDDSYSKITQLLNEIIEIKNIHVNHCFCTGRSGIIWFYNFLFSNKLIDEEDLRMLCYDNEILQQLSFQDLLNGNYDFLHGSLGTGYSYLFNYNAQLSEVYIKKIIIKLKEKIQSKSSRVIEQWNIKTEKVSNDTVNVGLAHGIPSILKFCIQCYKQGLCLEETYYISQCLIGYLIKHMNVDKTICFFPCFVTNEQNGQNTYSRLAWCYGDLGVGYILYQAGITFNNQEIKEIALKILKHSTKRVDNYNTNIYDAGFCHGSAGVAHIFNKIWHLTNEAVFKGSCDYWIQRTINYANFFNETIYFNKYNPINNNYEKGDPGLLEGSAGIGLVLLSYLTGDFNWDYCLMLND